MSNVKEFSGYTYAVTPEWILDADISDRAIRLFGVLSRYVGNNDGAWPSRKTLAERMHCSLPSVDSSIKELISIKALSVERRKRKDGSYTSSMYYLWPMTEGGVAKDIVYGSQKNSTRVAKDIIQHERTLIERESEKESIDVKKRQKVDYTEDFSEIWNIYPRRDNKSGGYKSYRATLNRGVDKEQLLLATKNYAKERMGQNVEYTLQAQTFFGPNERWRDFLPSTESESYKMSADDLKSAKVYDEYDSFSFWTLPSGDVSLDNPAGHGYTRPVDHKGQLIDSSGRAFQIDTASGKRKYISG
jgi:hypothetical protein